MDIEDELTDHESRNKEQPHSINIGSTNATVLDIELKTEKIK